MQIQCYRYNLTSLIVVICFKFSNFAYANTVIGAGSAPRGMLLFALNLVILLMQIQLYLLLVINLIVVICFKFSNFAYANTVIRWRRLYRSTLLFALNLVILLMQIQYELNKLLIVNALQRYWKIKKQQKSSPF